MVAPKGSLLVKIEKVAQTDNGGLVIPISTDKDDVITGELVSIGEDVKVPTGHTVVYLKRGSGIDVITDDKSILKNILEAEVLMYAEKK